MHTVFLKGKNIFLSTLSKEDNHEDYARWLNDKETTLFMESGSFPASLEGLKNYIEKYNNSSEGILLGIFLKKSKKHIGNITLHEINWRCRNAVIGILIGDKQSRGKGYATQAISLIAEHAFAKLNLRKLCGGVVKGNEASKRAFEKVGFKVEGVYREHFYHEGKYHDAYWMGLLIREYIK